MYVVLSRSNVIHIHSDPVITNMRGRKFVIGRIHFIQAALVMK